MKGSFLLSLHMDVYSLCKEPVQFVEDAMLVPPLSLSWSKCPFQTLYLLNECIGPKFNN